MKDFMTVLTGYSLALSLVILLYIAITPLLSKRYTARSLYYSWLVIVIGLIIPFRPQLNAAIMKVNAPAEKLFTNPIPNVPILPAGAVMQINAAVPNPALPNIRLWQLISIIWLTGAIFYLSYHGLIHYRFIQMVNRWSEEITDDQILMLMQSIKEDLGISGHIGLYVCPYIGCPMMIGYFRSRILLPMTEFSHDELRFILKHELVHYKRKDLWYKCLLLLATAMHWFNPIVHLMAKAVNIQCEISCDAEVINNANMNTRCQYCETIIEALRMQSKKLRTALSSNFYGGMKGMKSRISFIMDNTKKKLGLSVIIATLIVTAGAGIVSVAASSMHSDVVIKLRDKNKEEENCGKSVKYVDARPELDFYIEGEDIAQIEVSCKNEFVYAVDFTKTQDEKYWNVNYYQPYDEKTQTCTFYPERLYDKSMKFVFDEGFDDYGDILYSWTPWNMYQWASEDNYSHYVLSKTDVSDDMTEEQKLKLAAGDDGSGAANIGHILLDGCPEEFTRDRITIKITDREGNIITKYINVKISNNKLNQTVINARVEN